MTLAIPARAGQLIERLARVADRYHEPRADTQAVQSAIQEHLRRLGVGGRSVRLVGNFASGHRLAIDGVVEDNAWIGASRAAWRAAHREAWRSGAPWSTARRLAHVSARRTVAIAIWDRLRDLVSRNPDREHAAWPGRSEFDWAGEQARYDALHSAVDLVAWTAEPQIPQATERWIGILLPIVDAFEAGLWLWWVTPGEVLALLRPAVRYQRRWLHCEDGPAVVSPAGPSWYFWRGVRVPEKVILRPLDLTAHEIASEEDVEVRRVMLERYGPERFMQDIGATRVDADEMGELYRQELGNDEPLSMVRVLDATPQFDGTRRVYWLRVPPTIQTARAAVAWTFGMDAKEYRPEIET